MPHPSSILSVLLGLLLLVVPVAQAQDSPEILLRLDDIGMTQAVNHAAEDLAKEGVRFAVSAMPATPWFQHGAEILNRYDDQISTGIHLTLNSEWKGYRWGPVLGKEEVPSLVDEHGYFHPSISDFLESEYDLDEVERELDAQIQRAMNSGLDIDYLDHHMGTAVQTPELRQIVEDLAERYELGISRYFGESYESMWGTPIADKAAAFFDHLENLDEDAVNLVVIHASRNTDEMKLVDMNADAQNTADGRAMVHMHRSSERGMLLSDKFLQLVEDGAVTPVTYTDIIAREGLDAMEAPED